MVDTKTIQFECRKYSIRENADTTIRLALDLHPDDLAAAMSLFGHRRGTRFMCVLVEIDDDETPKPVEKQSVKKVRTIAEKMHILCKQKSFQKYIGVEGEGETEKVTKLSLGIDSFKDLLPREFESLMEDYQKWLIPPPS